MYLPIKTHKPHENFPGRPVVNQTCDPTYKLCKELQRIIHPLAVKAKSYIKDSRHFKQMLKKVNIEAHFIQLSFDTRSLFPSIPIKPTLSLIYKKLQNDKMLSERTRWKPKNIVKLIQIRTEETHSNTLKEKYGLTQMAQQLGSQYTGILLGFLWNPMRMSLFWIQRITNLHPYSGNEL